MSIRLEELPLFPLNAVLLPYQTLPVQVFEDRYREMIQGCASLDQPFGIVLIREGEEVGDADVDPYLVGTSARIVNHSERPDGTLDLLVLGERRFRIRRLDRTKPYLTGFVEPIVEMEWSANASNRGLLARAQESFETHLRNMFGRQDVNITVSFPDDPVALSFAMAGFVSLTPTEKQRFLEITDTTERFEELIPILENHALEYAIEGEPSAAEEFAEFINRN
ncbi:MAG: LON peptidase substrate-binding domain-containing protein [Fimbriimonadales bacterium]